MGFHTAMNTVDKPIVIELFAGLFGWSEGFISEGFQAIGFDIVDMCAELGKEKPSNCELVIQDVRTLHGSQFRSAACIVASPPCTEFSYRGRWGRPRKLPPPDTSLFEVCFRIAHEACVPIIVENVVFAQEFVGRACAHWGAYYLWGDVPPLLPFRYGREGIKGDSIGLPSRRFGSKTAARKRATAETSKIPFALSNWIAKCFKTHASAVA